MAHKYGRSEQSDPAERRRLAGKAAELLQDARNGWLETRPALVDKSGRVVALWPVAGYTTIGARELATTFGYTLTEVKIRCEVFHDND